MNGNFDKAANTETQSKNGVTNNLDKNAQAEKYRQEYWANSIVKFRDFGFPTNDIRHWGQPTNSDDGEESDDPNVISGMAKALYDFDAENPSEITFRKDDLLYINYRQCEGWLVGYLQEDKLGLIPENYVKLLQE